MSNINLYWVVLFYIFQVTYAQQFNTTVTTPLGKIKGDVGLTVNSNSFYKFEGVPYAKPPVGNLRFEEPKDPEPWTGTLVANTLTTCIQYDHLTRDAENNYALHGDEDCLYANIYTRSLSKTANLDVLLYIHGGAFMYGSGGIYGPEIIMDKNIVYVNFNYRLGPLGFLSTEDDVLPGNLGLKDQIKLLKWVKKYIQYFGGNPDSVTLYGFSAGGASVHFHYLSPYSKGLFKRGISQSGCLLNPWAIAEKSKEKAEKVATLLGCPNNTSTAIVTCLKTKSATEIVATVKHFLEFLYNPFSPFGVVIDGGWSRNPLLSKNPYNLLKEGKVQDLPWLVTHNTNEGLYPGADFYRDDVLDTIDNNWNRVIPPILHYDNTVAEDLKVQVSQKIRRRYLGQKRLNNSTFNQLVDILTNRLFTVGLEKAARLQNAVVRSNVYSYLFNYRGSISFSSVIPGATDEVIGVSHGDDTILILKVLNNLITQSDKDVSQLLVNIFSSFIQNGQPTAPVNWEPLSKNPTALYKILKINNSTDVELKNKNSVSDRAFWDGLPFQEDALQT